MFAGAATAGVGSGGSCLVELSCVNGHIGETIAAGDEEYLFHNCLLSLKEVSKGGADAEGSYP